MALPAPVKLSWRKKSLKWFLLSKWFAWLTPVPKQPCQHCVSPAALPVAIKSSNLKAATTVTVTAFSQAQVPVWQLFPFPALPVFPKEPVKDTLLAPYNDLDAVKGVFEKEGQNIAAIIVEPVAGNMGLVLPKEGFLEGLRALCDEHGALLIFDEVITGFRVTSGGVGPRFDVTPDLTTLGKIIGGGFPVGCYGGKKEYMSRIAPCGDVYQAGTLSGNPVAMAAGVATLRSLQQQDYDALELVPSNWRRI